jgi:hypothetical protein
MAEQANLDRKKSVACSTAFQGKSRPVPMNVNITRTSPHGSLGGLLLAVVAPCGGLSVWWREAAPLRLPSSATATTTAAGDEVVGVVAVEL